MFRISELLAAGLWPLVLLVSAVALVTIIALCRAKQDDVPRVFGSFAAAFGIRLHPVNQLPAPNSGQESTVCPIEPKLKESDVNDSSEGNA